MADELVRGGDLGLGLGQLLDRVRADAGHLLQVACSGVSGVGFVGLCSGVGRWLTW